MKDIKSVELPKYKSGDYEHVAFRVYRNKKARNYCLTLTADDMNEFIMEAILDQYSVSCTEHCGEETEIDGKTVCIAEFETDGDTIAELHRIIGLASAVGREIVDFEIDGNVFLCVKTGDVTIPTADGNEIVPIYSVREDICNGMLGFTPRYPDIPFTADMAKCIASKPVPGVCRCRAVLLQNFRAFLILEYMDETFAFVYGFEEKQFICTIKDKLLIAALRGYMR